MQQLEQEYERLRTTRSVRVALRLSRAVRSVLRALRPRRLDVAPADHEPADPAAEERLRRLLEEELAYTGLSEGPLVSVIVPTRDGLDHLRRLVAGLIERTAYRPFEVIVVDNGSTDGSVEYLEGLDTPFPLRTVRNDENRTFSEANNQGAATARGELLLFLNNDVEPIVSGWLARMVGAAREPEAAAVGARLIYPRRPQGAAVGSPPDLTLQHRGIDFVPDGDGIPRGRNLGAGEDPRSPLAAGMREVPAVTAACVLVRREDFDAVGGFSAGYVYGSEDVDLCLALVARGRRIVYEGSAALWHHEFGTQQHTAGDRRRRDRGLNRALFVDRWGPQLLREVLRDRLRGLGHWSEAPLRVALIGDGRRSDGARTVGDLVTELEGVGWEVIEADTESYEPSEDAPVDVVVSLSDRFDPRRAPHAVTIAWIRGDPGPWLDRPCFDDHDVVIVEDPDAAGAVERCSAHVADVIGSEEGRGRVAEELQRVLVRWTEAHRVGLLIGVPRAEERQVWGDHHFARAIQRQLERRGTPARVHILPEWETPATARHDVVIHLFGLSDYTPRPSQVNTLWIISHPERVDPLTVGSYDLVFVASDRFADHLARQVPVPVLPLHQATDPEVMRPDPNGPAHDLLFVGNSRRVRRRILDDLLPTEHDLAVYGADWTPDLVDMRHVRGEHVPNHEVHRYYSAAGIVLNDHWDGMREHGFLSNRLYDALASGAFVISDHVPGIEREFEDAVVTYRNREDLRTTIDRYLADADARRERGLRGRRVVLERHTFAHRVSRLLEEIGPLLGARPAGLVPDVRQGSDRDLRGSAADQDRS